MVTLAIQAFTSLAATAIAVLAPEVGPAVGLNPKLIGVFVGVLYLGAMLASLASGGFIERYGPIRVSQVCTVVCAVGLVLTTGPAWALLIAPALIGIGYGPITPASSQLLAHTASPHRMALTFSIKQTGVPLGAALAGALLPLIAVGHGWRAAVWAVAGSGVVIALLAQPTRAGLDVGLVREHRVSLRSSVRAAASWSCAVRKLLELTLTAFVYAATQACLLTFLVIYMTEELDRTLIDAGLVLTVATVGGIVGRISWGMVADRWIAPRRMLGLLGVVAGACALATAGFGPAWPDSRRKSGVRAVRRDGHRLEWRATRGSRPPFAAGPGRRGHRRVRIHQLLRRRRRTARVRADGDVTGSYATGFAAWVSQASPAVSGCCGAGCDWRRSATPECAFESRRMRVVS